MALLCIITPASMREVDLIFFLLSSDFTHCASLMSTHIVSFLLLTKHRQVRAAVAPANPHPFFIVLVFFSLCTGIRVSDAPSLSIATSGLREQLPQEEGKVNWLIPACCTIMLLLWYDQKFGGELINLSI